MEKQILVYKDRAGNTLYKKYIKTRGVLQYSAKNREGKVLGQSGARTLLKRAGVTDKKKWISKRR